MESEEKVELIKRAISKLIDDDKTLTADDEDDARRRQLLSKLMSEIELLEQETSEEIEKKGIIKELEKVKKQNSITHHLLTAMIVLTVAWQLSEVSMILKIKHRLSNPFKSVGDVVKGFLEGGKTQPNYTVDEALKAASDVHKQITQPTSLPGLKIPEISTTDEEDHVHRNN